MRRSTLEDATAKEVRRCDTVLGYTQVNLRCPSPVVGLVHVRAGRDLFLAERLLELCAGTAYRGKRGRRKKLGRSAELNPESICMCHAR